MAASCSMALSNTVLPGRSTLLSGGLCCSAADGWTISMDLCMDVQELRGTCLTSLKCP